MTRNRKIFLIISALLILLILVIWPRVKTPEGVDVSPINKIKFNSLINIIAKIENNKSVLISNKTVGTQKDTTILFGSPYNKYPDYISRQMELHKFISNDDALKEYKSYKDSFTNNSNNGQLFKEMGTGIDKYFISFEKNHVEYNHGIPCGIVSSPNILIAFLKNNILIVISYAGYNYYDHYVDELNEDIFYVSKLLNN